MGAAPIAGTGDDVPGSSSQDPRVQDFGRADTALLVVDAIDTFDHEEGGVRILEDLAPARPPVG